MATPRSSTQHPSSPPSPVAAPFSPASLYPYWLNHLWARQTRSQALFRPPPSNKTIVESIIAETCKNQYKHVNILKAHRGCVNALAFNTDGDLLATGGDDLEVLLWRVFDNEPQMQPVARFKGHMSNIFSIGFVKSSAHVMYSAGNDGSLIKYDITRASTTATQKKPVKGSPEAIYDKHDGGILKLSVKPDNDDVVLTAAQDGLILWDVRCSNPVEHQEETLNSLNSVMFNPADPNQFVTADDSGQLLLSDIRKLDDDYGGLMTYATSLIRGHTSAKRLDITSAVFSPCGKYI
ncbi:hypothetical protein HDV05_006342, partial [Chytridiales sp. JEL 0842]